MLLKTDAITRSGKLCLDVSGIGRSVPTIQVVRWGSELGDLAIGFWLGQGLAA